MSCPFSGFLEGILFLSVWAPEGSVLLNPQERACARQFVTVSFGFGPPEGVSLNLWSAFSLLGCLFYDHFSGRLFPPVRALFPS